MLVSVRRLITHFLSGGFLLKCVFHLYIVYCSVALYMLSHVILEQIEMVLFNICAITIETLMHTTLVKLIMLCYLCV